MSDQRAESPPPRDPAWEGGDQIASDGVTSARTSSCRGGERHASTGQPGTRSRLPLRARGPVGLLLHPDRSFWPLSFILAAVTISLFSYKLGDWPWDHDEVAGLVEVDALELHVQGAPAGQLERIRWLVPVWWNTQRIVLLFVKADEFGSRVLSAACGVLVVLSAFVLSWTCRGRAYAIALALLLLVNQPLVWLSQHNRFYSQSLLFLTWSLAALWWPTKRAKFACGLCVGFSVLAILSHNLLVVVYGILFLSALSCAAVGAVPRWVLIRTSLMAVAAGSTYALYLRPQLADWVNGDSGGTQPIISFAAMIGLPTLALALLGCSSVPSWGRRATPLLWWCVVLMGNLAFVGMSPMLITNWNPRYAVLFMAPAWVLAGFGIVAVSDSLGKTIPRVAWHLCVVMLLLPKLASHWQDGSRHDLRSAAEIAASRVQSGSAIFCNWPMELAYYARLHGDTEVIGWQGGELPDDSCVVVIASNAFEPVLRLDGRRCEVIAEISSRRFDEQSHSVRVYEVGAVDEID